MIKLLQILKLILLTSLAIILTIKLSYTPSVVSLVLSFVLGVIIFILLGQALPFFENNKVPIDEANIVSSTIIIIISSISNFTVTSDLTLDITFLSISSIIAILDISIFKLIRDDSKK